ncbi:MAG TPA: RNA 2',3'-cyclic phosphodiesterase [Chondromyces sp.]|nr:RNA 2',3'-cyclic phosphodiesterase [Chondromyces sp.]
MLKTHYFFALALPEETKLFLKDQCERMGLPFRKWVHHEDYHLTFAFLGQAEENMLQDSARFVGQAIERVETFPLTIHTYGTFGRSDSPRIFWAGTKEEKRLDSLHRLVYEACVKAGFSLDKKPFRPHITLARKWEGTDHFPESAKEVLPPVQHTFQAAEVALYQTHLDRNPKYEKKLSFNLEDID